jgi:hypothetical protein
MGNDEAPVRHWRDIAEEIRKEQDTKRRDELVRELDKALHEEKRNRKTLRINGRLILQDQDIPEK